MSVYGIDLGTTFSCIATLDNNGNPEVIRNQYDASDTLASAVFFESADNVIVGGTAKQYVETDGDRVVQFVKRDIGKPDAKIYEFYEKTYGPIDISALVLKRLKQICEEQGHVVRDVVITCPAYFGLEERNATKKAGELAGLNVLNLINEPTAAALSYCARQFQEEQSILVYDLGGGTFDVTIVKMALVTNANGEEVQQVKVVATGGNDRLGGKDWDDVLFDFILQTCCDECGLTPDAIDPETRQAIRGNVEGTKRRLSTAEAARVRVNVNGVMITVNISREEFENMTADKVAQTMGYVEKTLRDAGDIEVDLVLLVGGSTYMPMIRNAVEARFPGKVQLHEPDRAVAMGAAIYASMLVEESKVDPEVKERSGGGDGITHVSPITIEDQTPRSFGPAILSAGEYVIDNLIKMGEVMPATCVREYGTVADNQRRVVLPVYENMCMKDQLAPAYDASGKEQYTDPANQVKLLGELELLLPPNTRKGSPIEVTFQVDASGVYVKAVNLLTKEEAEVTIRMQSDDDVNSDAVTQLTVSAE